MTRTIDQYADLLDVRDIIERVEELETQRDNTPDEDAATWEQSDESRELAELEGLLEEMKGYGGDEQWRGDWYPITLIRESYFRDYAEELACDCGDYPKQVRWPYTCIDWEQAARELQMDYSSLEFRGVTFWYR